MEKFETNLAEILEVDSLESNAEFSSFDSWDSLTILSVIAYCDSEYNIQLSAEEIENSKTVNGLKSLILSNNK